MTHKISVPHILQCSLLFHSSLPGPPLPVHLLRVQQGATAPHARREGGGLAAQPQWGNDLSSAGVQPRAGAGTHGGLPLRGEKVQAVSCEL